MAGVLCSILGASYAPAVVNAAVTFDGTGDNYSATGLTTTATDGKFMTVAFTFYLPSSATDSFMDLFAIRLGTATGQGVGFGAILQSTRLHSYFPDNSGSNTGQTYGDYAITTSNDWHQIVYYHDANAFANCKYYVDGVDRTSNLLNGPSFGEVGMQNINFNWGATNASVIIGNGIAGWIDAASDFNGRFSQLYVHNASGQPNINDYWDTSTNVPRNLGTNGTATGLAQPLIYHYGATATFPTNNGTGFNSYTLTANGGVTSAEGPTYSTGGASTTLMVGSTTSPQIAFYNRVTDTYTRLSNPATMPGSTYGVAFNATGTRVGVASSTSPYISVYNRSGDTFTKIANPASLPDGRANGVAWNPAGTSVAVAVEAGSTYVFIYNLSGDTLTKVANPATLPGGPGLSIAWNNDGSSLAIGHDFEPYVTIYNRSGDTFTKVADPATTPGSAVFGITWSPDGSKLVCATASTPYVVIYNRSGDTFTKVANPATLPTGEGHSVAWSPDGTKLAVAHSVTPFVTIYNRSGDTYTKQTNPGTLPTGAGFGVAWDSSGGRLAVGHGTTPYITIYNRNGNTYTKQTNPGSLPAATVWSVDWN